VREHLVLVRADRRVPHEHAHARGHCVARELLGDRWRVELTPALVDHAAWKREQMSPRLVRLLDQDRRGTGARRPCSGREPRRAAADHEHIARRLTRRRVRHEPTRQLADTCDPPRDLQHRAVQQLGRREHLVMIHGRREEPVRRREKVRLCRADDVLRLDVHAIARRRAARHHAADAVDAHQATIAATRETRGPARSVVLHAAREHPSPGRGERDGHGLARNRRHLVPIDMQR